MTRPETRVGDAERERAATLLADACAAGRIDAEELDARLERAWAARTVADIERVTHDLPASPERRRAPEGAPSRRFWPGIRGFHERHVLRAEPDDAYAAALRNVVPPMELAGLHLVQEHPPTRMVFAGPSGRRVTLLLLPVPGGGTELSAFGVAQRAVRKAFAELSD